MWVVWGDTEANTIANCTKEKLDENAMTVKLRKDNPVDEPSKTVWVTTPFFTNWTHEASSGTNRFYKIVVDDLSEDILKDRAQANE